MHCKSERGQSVVEMALILPLFFFVLVTYFQLLMTCHNAIVLQNIAAKAVRSAALSDGSTTAGSLQTFLSAAPLLGSYEFPQVRRDNATLNPWQSFKGLETIQDKGSWMSSQVTSGMLPRALFIWRLPVVPLNFSAEFPKEPPVPEES